MKKFSALLMFVFAASLFANEPPAAPAENAKAAEHNAKAAEHNAKAAEHNAKAAEHHAKPAPAKKKPAAHHKKAPAHKPTSQIEPKEPTAAASDKPVEGGEGN